jgi:anti-sigma factor RsiW
MSTEHPPLERLSELLDGDLGPDVAADVERHLTECSPCRERLTRLRALLDRAAALPSTIEPPPQLWPGLRRRLTAPASFMTGPRHWVRRWGLRAAAALLLVASSSALTVLALRSGSGGRAKAAQRATPVAAVPASVTAVERSYAPVVDELTVTLRAQRARLAPSTVATLERTLRVIDEAIAEARAALAADPSNDALLDVLSANYEQKVQLLRRASELPART